MMNLFANDLNMNTVPTLQEQDMARLLGVAPETLNELNESARDESQELHARAKLKSLVQRYSLLLDTCILLGDRLEMLLEHLLPLLQECGKQLLLPFCIVMELQHVGKNQPEMADRVAAVTRLLLELKEQGLLVICGEGVQSWGASQKLATVQELMQHREILVVTRDNGLSRALLGMGRVDGKYVGVGYINGHGYLSRFRLPEAQEDTVRGEGPRLWQRSACIQCGSEFAIFDMERDYYLRNGLALPRRCPACRKMRRQMRTAC